MARTAEQKAKAAAQMRAWRLAHPGYNFSMVKRWQNKNPDKLAAQQKRNRERHIDAKKAQKLDYYYANKPAYRHRESQRRRKQRGTNGTYSLLDFQNLCDKYANKCLSCGRINVQLTADHVVPLSMGGSNTIDNIQPLCGKCNDEKGTITFDFRVLDRNRVSNAS